MPQSVQLCCTVTSSQEHKSGRNKCNLLLHEHSVMSMPDKLTAQKTNMTRACFTDHFIPFMVNGALGVKLLNSPVPAPRQFCCSLDPRLNKISQFAACPSKSSTLSDQCRAQNQRLQGGEFTTGRSHTASTPGCRIAHCGASPAP